MNQADQVEQISSILSTLDPQGKAEVLKAVREQEGLRDALEIDLNTDAVHIVGALRLAGGLVLRMFRGVLGEYMFGVWISNQYPDWKIITPAGDHPYDLLLERGGIRVRVQVKLLRSTGLDGGAVGTPLDANDSRKMFSKGLYVVETDKTRAGSSAGESTRPIRFGDFDLLAVCMWPVTGEWTDFRLAPQRWLLPRKEAVKHLYTMQPVPLDINSDWTGDLEEAVNRLHSSENKTVSKTIVDTNDITPELDFPESD